MATLARRGTGTPATTGTTWASVTNAVDGTAGTNPATYSTMTNATASAVATIEITGYAFSDTIAAADTLNSVSVALRHFENNTGRFASVAFQAFDGATSIGTATTCTLATGARTDTATVAATLTQLRSSTFKIRVTITGAASTQSRVFSIDQVDVTADYTPLAPTLTQAAYRWYDEGTETGAVALAAQDTPATGDVTVNDGIGQLRVRLQSTNAGTLAATDDYRLQYNKNGGGWNDVVTTGTEALLDSFSETNQDTTTTLGILGVGDTRVGQSFLGDGKQLSQSAFWVRRNSNPAGTIISELYAHTGTFGAGATALPTGSALATSATVAASTVPLSVFGWVSFTFDQSYTLAAGTPYFIALTYAAGDASNNLTVGTDNTSGTHPGNSTRYISASIWQSTAIDRPFQVYTATLPTTVVGYNSPNLTDQAATTNRLGAGTGTFVAGKISEDGLADNHGWSANNYTELVFSLALKKADLVNGDTLTFRVLRNGATTGLTYTAVPTINVAAAAVTTGTALISSAVETTVTGTPTVTGTALTSTAVDVTATGIRETFGTALIEITGNTSATAGGVTTTGTVIITTSIDTTVAGTVIAEIVTGTAALTESVAVTVTGTVVAEVVTGTALLTQSAAITVAGTVIAEVVTGTALIPSTVAVTVAGTVVAEIVTGTALLSETVAVTVAGTVVAEVVAGTAAITESVAVTVAGTVTRPGGGVALINVPVAITAQGTVVAEVVTGTALIASAVTVTVAGARAGTGTALVSASVAVTATGTRAGAVPGTAIVASSVTIDAVGTVIAEVVTGTALIAASVSIVVSVLKVYERAPYTATWSLVSSGTLEVVVTGTANFDYVGGWDTNATSTVDHDYAHSWELV